MNNDHGGKGPKMEKISERCGQSENRHMIISLGTVRAKFASTGDCPVMV